MQAVATEPLRGFRHVDCAISFDWLSAGVGQMFEEVVGATSNTAENTTQNLTADGLDWKGVN
jgi:hypothetical protein